VVLFHHGRGGQEALSAQAKQDVAFQTVPTKRATGASSSAQAVSLALEASSPSPWPQTRMYKKICSDT
jgi:hypothetical protein